ncbi:methionyl-tRNA formyltransferase [Patescibacteria group bacterium]|nr:methionyl-tRNA formyltransferase [Patescibacteria group bacterium]
MKDKNPKIIFFGSPEFALPTLKLLVQKKYNIALVITQADQPIGRKQILTPTAVKILAKKLNLSVSCELNFEKIKKLKPDLGIVVAYGKFIPKEIMDLFTFGVLNLHPSALPKYRGPSPIQTAILNGDKKTAVTLIKLDQQMDHGPIIGTKSVKIKENETAETLHNKLAELGAVLLLKILPDYLAGKIKTVPQKHQQASYTKLLARNDGKIQWQKKAEEIAYQLRAFYPWPGSFTEVNFKNLGTKRVKIISGDVSPSLKGLVAGDFKIDKNNFLVQCGQNSLNIKKLQLAGKKEIIVAEFIRGYGKNIESLK